MYQAQITTPVLEFGPVRELRADPEDEYSGADTSINSKYHSVPVLQLQFLHSIRAKARSEMCGEELSWREEMLHS